MQLRYALLDVPFAQKIRAEGTIRKTRVLLVCFFCVGGCARIPRPGGDFFKR